MKRPIFFCLFFVALAFNLAASSKPNLVIFIADDFSFNDIGCFGSPDAKTPHLDRLASEGMKLTRLYTAAPTCSPTRAALYTALYPVKNGAHPNHSSVKPGTKSIPHYLHPLGYRVGLIGKSMMRPAESFPFDQPQPSKGKAKKLAANEEADGDSLDFAAIKRYITQDKTEPFCLVVASHQPHGPWDKGDASKYNADKLTMPPYLVDTPEAREQRTRYLAEVTFLDGEVGRVLKMLKEAGREENTLFLFLSEQGASIPRGKYNLYDTGILSASIARWPGKIKPGSESDVLASYVDIVPTFIEAAGGRPVSGLDGRSLLKVLTGKTNRHSDYVFAQATSRGVNGVKTPYAIRAVVDDRFKYIWNLNHTNKFPCSGEAQNPDSAWNQLAKTDAVARERLQQFLYRPEVELFDLKNDPWELNNLASDPAHQERMKKLRQQLEAWMKDQGDEGIATELAVEPREKPKRAAPKAGKTKPNTSV